VKRRGEGGGEKGGSDGSAIESKKHGGSLVSSAEGTSAGGKKELWVEMLEGEN